MKWIKEWKQDVKVMETQVKEIKSRLRKDWTQYPKDLTTYFCTFTKMDKTKLKFTPNNDQWELLILKHKLTHFYQFRAANRNKKHVEALPAGAWGLKTHTPDLTKYMKLRDDELAEREETRKQLQTLADLEIIGAVDLAHQ